MRYAAALTVIGFSLLLLGCRAQRQRPSTAVFVTLVRRGPDPFPGMTDADGLYVMTILAGYKVRIRHEEIRFENLGRRLEEAFRTRAERLLLVKVEGSGRSSSEM